MNRVRAGGEAIGRVGVSNEGSAGRTMVRNDNSPVAYPSGPATDRILTPVNIQ